MQSRTVRTGGLRRWVLAAAASMLVAAAGIAWPAAADRGADSAGPASAAAYQSPVRPLTVVRAFHAPLSRYGPGHRGVDLDTSGTGEVAAAGSGTVSFAGSVAGRGVVVIQHADGVRTEYEPLRPDVQAGQLVVAGQSIGTIDGVHPGCTQACLHWGARRGDDYFDPLVLLRPLGPVRLVPWGAPVALARSGAGVGLFEGAA